LHLVIYNLLNKNAQSFNKQQKNELSYKWIRVFSETLITILYKVQFLGVHNINYLAYNLARSMAEKPRVSRD